MANEIADFNLNEMFGLTPPVTAATAPAELSFDLEALLDGSGSSDPSHSASDSDEFDLEIDGIEGAIAAYPPAEPGVRFSAAQAAFGVDRQRKRKAAPDAATDTKPTKKPRSKRAEAQRLPARFEVVPADESKQAKAAARDTAVRRLTTDPFFRLQEAQGPIDRGNFCGGTTRAAGTSQCHFHFTGKTDKQDPLFSIKWSHADRRYQAFCRTGLEAAPAPAAKYLRREIVAETVLAAQLSTLNVFAVMKKAMMARMEAAGHDGLVSAAKSAAAAVDAQLLGSLAQSAPQPQQAPVAPSGSPDSPCDHHTSSAGSANTNAADATADATATADANANANANDGFSFSFCAESGSNTAIGDAYTGAADDSTTSGFFFFEQQQEHDSSDADSLAGTTSLAKTPRIDPGGQLQELLPDLPTSGSSYYLHPQTAHETVATIVLLHVSHTCRPSDSLLFMVYNHFGGLSVYWFNSVDSRYVAEICGSRIQAKDHGSGRCRGLCPSSVLAKRWPRPCELPTALGAM